jgi:hypothetical protein
VISGRYAIGLEFVDIEYEYAHVVDIVRDIAHTEHSHLSSTVRAGLFPEF